MSKDFLSQEEVDDLLKGVSGEADDAKESQDDSAVRPYNIATQERIVRGRMPTLELINERFARLLERLKLNKPKAPPPRKIELPKPPAPEAPAAEGGEAPAEAAAE